ncbi:MAG: SusC/RagA family TonB-linked outer membrane protein, partial [Ginsengibacter sp.]
MRTLLIFKTIKWEFIFSIITLIFLTTFCNEAFGQNMITVKGVVRDKTTQEVLRGVSISTGKPLKGIGITNEKGAFDVDVKRGAELVFTFVDHETFHKAVVSNELNLEISLSPKSGAMKEVVVQGFKSVTRETATGSSTIIKGKALQDVPVSNVVQLLQGKVAGLNIQNNTGSPGGMGTINLRGISSIQISSDGFLTPTSPLFVIDGVPVDLNTNYQYGFQSGGPGINPMSLIPPEDIEQVDVLKDAAATSQYGSRGAYGVILITTKRGQSKIPIVRYSGNFFMSTVPKLRDVIGGKDERTNRINSMLAFDTSVIAAQALINQTAFLSDSLNPFYNNSTDWQRYFFRNTYNQQHNISISGGDSKFNYNTNMNYYQESGIVQNTGFKRYSLSMNALYQPTSAFRMLVTLSSGLGQKQNGSGVGLVQTGVASGPSTSSLLPPPSLFSANNEALASSRVSNSNKTDNISSSIDLQYEPIKGIRFGNLLSYSYNSSTSEIFTPSFLNNSTSKAYSYNDRTYTIYDRSTITFIKSLNDIHNFSAFLFNEINSYGFRANAIQLKQTASDQITGPIGYSSSLSNGGTLDNLSDTRQEAYGASFSYNYDRKYVIDLDYRLDGLSTNGPSQGYSQNPAISLRWNFNKEKLFDKSSWLSYGALRGSWGRNITPTGSIFDVYGKYIVGLNYNNNPTVTIDYSTAPNTNFKPKTQTESNVGLELGLWDNAVQATFETYYRSIDNQVMGISLANINGFQQLQTNAVSLVDYGFEWTGTFRIFKQSHPLQWTLSVNGALSRDILTELPSGLRQMTVQIKDNGGNVPIIYKIGRNSLSN